MSKEVVNYILDNSSTEDDFKKNIHNYAKSALGEDVIDQLKQESSDENSYIKALADKISQPKETLESKYLDPAIYPALEKATKVADVIGTVPQAVAAPFGYLANTASNLIQGKDLETKPELLKNPIDWIKRYGTVDALSRTIDTPNLDKPFGDMGLSSRDEDISSQFPKAKQFLQSLTPKQVLNAVGDIPILEGGVRGMGGMAQTAPAQNAMASVSSRLKEMAVPHIENALVRLADSTDETAQMYRKGKFKSMANTLSDYGLAGVINDPVKLHDGAAKLIPDFAQSVKDSAAKVTQPIDMNMLKNDILTRLENKYDTSVSGVPFDGTKAAQVIDGMIKTDSLTLPQLIDLKSNIGNYVYELKKAIPTDVVLGASNKAIYNEAWKAIDDVVNQVGDRGLIEMNKKLSDLIEVRNQLNTAKVEAMKTPTLPQMAVGMGTGAAISSSLGVNPLFGGAVYPAMRYGVKGIEYQIPALTGKAIDAASNAAYSPIEKGLPLQYNIPAQAGISIGSSMNKLLNDYKLPRSYDEMMKELPLVKQKLTQVMGEQAANTAVDHMTSSPEEFFDKMPLLEMQMPDLFRYDRYRRVNGRIFDPTLKKLAEEEIKNSPATNTEKMTKQSMLLKNGMYDGI